MRSVTFETHIRSLSSSSSLLVSRRSFIDVLKRGCAVIAFYLRRDLGGRYDLGLQRTPVDLVEKRVRLVGTLVAAGIVAADGVAPA
jgi:hypothetical protein